MDGGKNVHRSVLSRQVVEIVQQLYSETGIPVAVGQVFRFVQIPAYQAVRYGRQAEKCERARKRSSHGEFSAWPLEQLINCGAMRCIRATLRGLLYTKNPQIRRVAPGRYIPA
jgi:hypothetical protein